MIGLSLNENKCKVLEADNQVLKFCGVNFSYDVSHVNTKNLNLLNDIEEYKNFV